MTRGAARRTAVRAKRAATRNATRRRAVWAGALAAVFLLGIGLGVLGGYGAGFFDRSGSRVAIEAESAGEAAIRRDPPRETLYDLPVTVRSSDRARKAYLDAYEEDLRAAPPPPRLSIPSGPAPPVPSGHAPEKHPAPGAPMADTPDQPTPQPPRAESPGGLDRHGPSTPMGEASEARPAWIANARAVPLDPSRPILAIVIDDVGVDVAHSREAVRLPAPLTFAFLPYGYDLPAMTRTAREGGHEIMVHLPMEPENREVDPGPHALMTDLPPEEIDRRIAWNLARIDGPVGLNNHMGSKFSARPEGMRRVLRALSDRGLFFLDSVTSARTTGYRLAEEMGVPFAVRDIFIDHTLDKATIRAQLEKAVETAKRQGHAVAIGHPHDETIDVLRDWLPTVAGQGVQLVPMSAVIRRRYGMG
ncbi:divergent polysaccharide deacetylase family protein [Marivibrio halodurans]|uniref:Divergent polysaccharide deacetylase family protein n=1 Tax=Marivibrio halodurans TaxID=2039722 RepID=A0A8J7RYJ5_9PROT|nr:divergent polysaccharide deacetylase family protein [Marivibrio halodurans]MBP5855478.1 divergent polysaccharide deacetylase family protein [Marivibrio halodurans]